MISLLAFGIWVVEHSQETPQKARRLFSTWVRLTLMNLRNLN